MADLDADYRKILGAALASKKNVNSRYSNNSFARTLGVDATYLSKLSRGKILLSLDLAEKITRRLKLSPAERTRFLLSAAEEQRCHAMYLIDPALTDCDSSQHEKNLLPASRKKVSRSELHENKNR